MNTRLLSSDKELTIRLTRSMRTDHLDAYHEKVPKPDQFVTVSLLKKDGGEEVLVTFWPEKMAEQVRRAQQEEKGRQAAALSHVPPSRLPHNPGTLDPSIPVPGPDLSLLRRFAETVPDAEATRVLWLQTMPFPGSVQVFVDMSTTVLRDDGNGCLLPGPSTVNYLTGEIRTHLAGKLAVVWSTPEGSCTQSFPETAAPKPEPEPELPEPKPLSRAEHIGIIIAIAILAYAALRIIFR